MPAWMEPYRALIVNTGGNKIEDMMNGNADPRVNLPLSTLQACVKSQVIFLEQLRTYNLLVKDPGRAGHVIKQRNALETIAESVAMVLASRQVPAKMRSGLQAIVEQARGAL